MYAGKDVKLRGLRHVVVGLDFWEVTAWSDLRSLDAGGNTWRGHPMEFLKEFKRDKTNQTTP